MRAGAQAKPPYATSTHSQSPPPLKQDEDCLSCHGQAGITSGTGKNISIDSVKHGASVYGTIGCRDCHTSIKEYPHPNRVVKVQCSTCHADEASHLPESVHSALGDGACQSCHGDPHEVGAAAQTAPAKCAQCHGDEVKEFRKSIHGQAAASGDPDAPNCASCHGPAHQIRAPSDAASTVARRICPNLRILSQQRAVFVAAQRSPSRVPLNSIGKARTGERWQRETRLPRVVPIVTAATKSFRREM